MLKITVIGSNGQASRTYIAKDAAHADRIKARAKNVAGVGNSVDFKVKSI